MNLLLPSLRITKWILMVILFVILIFAAITVVTSKTSAFFGIKSYVVLTGSMTPNIPAGSVIYTIPFKNFKSGDIVTFKSNDRIITHRIVGMVDDKGNPVSGLLSPISGKNNYLFKTKGDANKSVDSISVPKDDVLGKVIVHFPRIGELISSLRTPIGFLIAVILPALAYIGFELWTIKGEIEKRAERKILEKMGMI